MLRFRNTFYVGRLVHFSTAISGTKLYRCRHPLLNLTQVATWLEKITLRYTFGTQDDFFQHPE
jgi:hypothetical protein